MRRSMLIALAAGLVIDGSWSCAAAPRQRPVRMGPVETGAGSLQAARRELEGAWSLASLELVDAAGARQPVKASGRLVYDAYGNLTINGTIDDPRMAKAIVLDFTGRIVIDPAKQVFYAADVVSGAAVDSTKLAPVGLDKVRRYSVSGDTLIVTYLDASGSPTAVATWRKAGNA